MVDARDGGHDETMLFDIVLALTIGCIAFTLARENKKVPRPAGPRGWIRARGWGLLLLPVAMAAAAMAGGAHGLIPAELGLAVLAIVFAPKLAAKLVPFGVLGLAVFGFQLARMYGDGFTNPVHYLFVHAAPGAGARTALVQAGVLFVARLVALGMSLRAAERMFATNPEAALALVTEARETSSRALTDLRDLVRGIYPPVLADRGLADAVRALALDTPLHTELDIDLSNEVELPVGAAVYFAVAEVLANAVRHSGARTVRIHLGHSDGMLRAEITDDGAGGADPAQGTGLTGVERRLATFDGILALSSPPGGPTIVVIEVPCALSSAKTSSC